MLQCCLFILDVGKVMINLKNNNGETTFGDKLVSHPVTGKGRYLWSFVRAGFHLHWHFCALQKGAHTYCFYMLCE